MVGFSTPPSPVLRPVDRRVLSSQLLPLAYARSGSNLSTKPKFFAALSAGGCCMDVQRGAPNYRTLDRASARQADSETQLGSPCTASPRPLLLASPSEDSQPRVRCVERKGVLWTEGCSRLSFCHSPTLAPEATSLRNLSLTQLFLLAAAAWTCREGPRTPNSRPSFCKAGGQRDATWLSLYGVSTSFSYSEVPPRRILSREFVVSSVKAFVDRRVLSSQLLPLAYARSGSNLSTKPRSYAALSAGGCCMDVQRGAPNSELSTELLQGRRTARRNLALLVRRLHVILLLASPSEEDSQPRVRCVERKGVRGQKGALVSASAPRLRSLRKQPLYETSFLAALSAGGCCTDVQRGAPNSELSTKLCEPGGQRDATWLFFYCLSSSQADSETQLGSPFTASPRPHLLASPSEDYSQPRVRCVERKGVCGQKGALVSASATRLRSLRKQPLYETSLLAACLLADAARTCREGPELRTLDRASARQADSETQLGSPCTASPRPLLLESPSEDSQPRVRCVERKGVCGQKGALVSASATRLRSLRKQPLYETSLLTACLLADAARTCREGPRTPNSRPSSASQADSETQLGSPCTASPRPLLLESPSEDSQPRVRCVERKGVCGQKGALVSASATRLRSLRKQPLYETSFLAALSAGGCCTDVQRGAPELRTLDQALRARLTAGRNLALLLLRLLLTDRGASSEVSRSTVRCVERKGVCGQKGALVSASAPRLRSLRKQPLYEKSFLAACLLAAAAWTCKRGPRTPNSRPSSARQADNGTQLWLFFYCVSTSSPPHESLGNRSQGKSCPNR
ncbi:hypothetical protein Avbf_02499 [Armadillidium vulgare]|nr:hypothetical protein Avbf_02499 [Armadillidium vulgare]